MVRNFNWSRGLAAVLWASLCINALLAGYVITTQMERFRPPAIVAGPQRLMEIVASRLPKEDADLLWRVFRTREADIRAAQGSYQTKLTGAASILEQHSPDLEALRRAILEARDMRVALGDKAIGVLLEALPQMSVAGRQRLVRSLKRP